LHNDEVVDATVSEHDMHEKHVANVFNDIEHEQEIVSETPVEVLSAHHILSSVAKKDLEILQEVLDSRNADENVEYISFMSYVSKSHSKNMKSKNGNNKYNTRYKDEHLKHYS